MTFPGLTALRGFKHRFVLRHPDIDVNAERAEVLDRLQSWHLDHVHELGFATDRLFTAEQVHGDEIAVIANSSERVPAVGCDGLITNLPSVMLGIYVADCCAVYLADPARKAFGLLHSGKKGTEKGITRKAIALMQEHFGSRPSDIIVQLSPCIRPPAYEIDFAADIRQQALDSGISPANLHDSGICTSSDLSRFYSYRMEKGKTGRMMALLGRHE